MISINFANKNYPFINRIVRVILVSCMLLFLIAAWLTGKFYSLRGDLTAVQQKLTEAEAADEQVKASLLERERLVRDLNAMSGLMSARKFSWTRMFTQLETVVPVGVALKNVAYNPKERTLSMEGAAHSPESLRNLVVGLERSKSFSDPYLKHQSLDKGTIEFNVVAVYQEQKNAALAHASR